MWVQIAAAVMSAMSGTHVNQSGAASLAEGGYGEFAAKNKGGINSALIQFDNPVHVAVCCVVVVGAVYAVKKWGK